MAVANPTATVMVMEDGADLPEHVSTEADRRLDSVYGDHPHQNDGRHLDGGVADDPFWQGRWKRIVQLHAADQSFILSPVEEWGGGLWPS